jgi:DNA-binding NtrC family response regulator
MNKLKNILIVDDEKLLCWALQTALTDAGHRVRIAADAEEAWDLIQKGGYEAIISDLRLKGMSGLDLLDKVKALDPEIAVILMTASGTRTSARRALDRGALGVVEKPFDIADILSLLEGPGLIPEVSPHFESGR